MFSNVIVFADESVNAQSIKVSVKNNVMKTGEIQRLIVNVMPADSENVSLEYVSDRPDIVTAAIGTIIAKSEGTAIITVRIAGTEIKDFVKITVRSADSDKTDADNDKISVSRITPQNKTLYIERYDTEKIRCNIYPENATDKELLYESSDTRVVTVDDNGYVYGRKNGNATIKISSADGGAETSVRVYVSDAEDYDEEETRLRNIYITQDDEIVKDKIELMEKSTLNLSVKTSPKSANAAVKWRSSNKKIASVDDSGNVAAHRVGSCTIYATAENYSSKRDSVTVIVTEYVKYPDSISVVPEENAIFQTENKVRFKAEISPADTTEKNIIWSASGGGRIDQNGVLTITDGGEITVNAYSSNRKVSGEYKFIASYSSEHFTLCGESYNVLQNRSFEIEFDADVNSLSAIKSVFVSADENGNGECLPIIVQPDKNVVRLMPSERWPTGDIYVFVKSNICDISGNMLGTNLKYKLNIRGGFDETKN